MIPDMNSWRPDFATLRLFVAVCEEASISKAAERECIVSSAISKRIAELEASFGLELLIRGGRGVKPTAAGTALLHHARHMLLSAARLNAELGEYAQGVRGQVRVLANISAIVEFLPRDVSTFVAQNEQIRVSLEERVSTQVVEGVRDGSADIGICLGNTDTEGVHRASYGHDTLVLVAHPHHTLAARQSVTFDDILDHPLVGLQSSSRMTVFLNGLAAKKDRSLNYRNYVGTYEAACHIIAENLGVAILAEQAVRIPQAALGLRSIRLAEPWARREIVLCVRDLAGLTVAARKLFEHLEARGKARGD